MSELLPNKPLQPASGAANIVANPELSRRRSRLGGMTLGGTLIVGEIHAKDLPR